MSVIQILANKLLDATSIPAKLELGQQGYSSSVHILPAVAASGDNPCALMARPLEAKYLDRFCTAVIRTIVSVYRLGCIKPEGQGLPVLERFNGEGLAPDEQSLYLREFSNPTPPRGIAKLVFSNECAQAIYFVASAVVVAAGSMGSRYLDELAEALDIPRLEAQRLHVAFGARLNALL